MLASACLCNADSEEKKIGRVGDAEIVFPVKIIGSGIVSPYI
jgi:hypothetical protein